MFELLAAILLGIVAIEAVLFAAVIMWKRRQRARLIYRPSALPQHNPQAASAFPPEQHTMSIPRRAIFSIDGAVASLEATKTGSYIVGVEVPNIGKLELSQPVAISGQEIVEEELRAEPINIPPPKIEGRRSETEVIKSLLTKSKEQRATEPKEKPSPIQHPLEQSSQPEKMPELRPRKCSKCGTVRNTRNTAELYICYICKKKEFFKHAKG